MDTSLDLTRIGTALGQPARSAIALELLDGRARTATELADVAGVGRATASSHLALLLDGGLLRVERQGRHRYYRLASPDVAETLETLLVLTDAQRQPTRRFGPDRSELRRARMCYDHVAGALGVGLARALVGAGALVEDDANFRLTPHGEAQLTSFGIDVEEARRKRRYFARTCLDWSERQPHLAGALGAALADRLFALGWIEREPEGRALHITAAGVTGLRKGFGLDLQAVPTEG
jgi:DNA-binding transcriptional ArsR family regulator